MPKSWLPVTPDAEVEEAKLRLHLGFARDRAEKFKSTTSTKKVERTFIAVYCKTAAERNVPHQPMEFDGKLFDYAGV